MIERALGRDCWEEKWRPGERQVKTGEGRLTATNVPGRKNILSIDIVFIAALSIS